MPMIRTLILSLCLITALPVFTLCLPARASVGGGFTASGLTGRYYNNSTFAGTPSFTRVDQRLDFGTASSLPPGGVGTSGEPGYGSVGSANWSAIWTGQVIPRFSGAYHFKTFARDAVTIKLRKAGSTAWTTIVKQPKNLNRDSAADFSVVAGTVYDIEVDFAHRNGAWGLNLRWSQANVPEEVIDSLGQVGLNANDKSAMFADIVKCARNSWLPASGQTPPPTDANGWPLADAGYVFQESLNQGLDVDPLMRGTVAFSFNGSGTVTIQGNCNNLQSNYNAATNVTSGTFQVFNNHWNASFFRVANAQRNDGTGHAGFTNLRMMRPTSPDATTAMSPTSTFIPPIRDAMTHFSVLRFQLVANQQRDWADRTLPSFFNQAGGSTTSPHYGNGSASDNGTAWEYEVMLCNETGRDMMISVPTVASGVLPSDTTSYIYNLANLLKWGSDGVNPYTGPAGSATAHPQPASGPVFAPLNANLRVYLELENELWNWAGPFYTDFSNLGSLATADKTANNADYQAFNYDNIGDVNIWRFRKAIQRMIEISNIFRSIWGDAAMPGASADPHVRPLYEWQYDNANATAEIALAFADNFYNNADGAHVTTPHPVNYYLWGGGGATYYGATNGDGLTTILPNSSFATPALAATGYSQAPSGATWTFSGTAGIAKSGGDVPPAFSGTQVGYVTDKGSTTLSFTVPATQTSDVYGFSFKAVNRIKSGATAADTENIRVLLDGATDITARTFSQGNGYTPPGYDSAAPWIARNVPWTNSQYYFTKSFNAKAGSQHTITIKGMGDINKASNVSQTTFLGEVRLTSADAIFAGGIPGGGQATGQPPAQNYIDVLNIEANWARAYGLQELAYEGGWSLGGDDGGSWVQNIAKYGDARAKTAQTASLDMFYQAGSSVSVLGTYAQWPSWADSFAQQGLLNVAQYPVVQGVDAYASRPPATPTNCVNLPATVKPPTATLRLNATNATIGAKGGWISWNVFSPGLKTYTVTAVATGSYALWIDDSKTVASGGTISLTPGLHAVRVQSTSGAVTVTSLTLSIPGTASPA